MDETYILVLFFTLNDIFGDILSCNLGNILLACPKVLALFVFALLAKSVPSKV